MRNVRTHALAVALAAVGLALGALVTPAGASGSGWAWPLQPTPEVVAGFAPPPTDFGAGHRGVDLLAQPGVSVRAVADGVVTYAGLVAGKPVVVVDHGRERSTYEPVRALVPRGTRVASGQVVGLLSAVGSHCLPAACLHLGRKVGDDYLDPLDLLGDAAIQLKPMDGLTEPAPMAALAPVRPGVAAGLALGWG